MPVLHVLMLTEGDLGQDRCSGSALAHAWPAQDQQWFMHAQAQTQLDANYAVSRLSVAMPASIKIDLCRAESMLNVLHQHAKSR